MHDSTLKIEGMFHVNKAMCHGAKATPYEQGLSPHARGGEVKVEGSPIKNVHLSSLPLSLPPPLSLSLYLSTSLSLFLYLPLYLSLPLYLYLSLFFFWRGKRSYEAMMIITR